MHLVSQLLTQSAYRTLEQIAIIDGKRQLTYEGLDSLSNQFAHRLLAAGVQRGDRVGLYLDKSLQAVAALFGIMKTGAAYVPLDPASPVQRIAFIVESCAQSLTPYMVYAHLGPEPIYRTGDLVREEADGNYTYLGRRNNQSKSRGYRIELGEIETVLYSHPNIEEAAVIPVPDDEIGNQIHAFIVADDGAALTGNLVMAFCAKHLPKYMVPHAIELCPALPKTSTGKVDKTQLRSARTL
ncbi:MAG: AMP-binding protein [Caldilineaceae bacterium]